MKLYGTTNYAEWSCAMADQFKALGLGLNNYSKPPSSINANRENELAIALGNTNTHARKLIIESLSDEIYDEVFTNMDATLLIDAKALWDELKKRYIEPDVFKTYFDLHKKAVEKQDLSKVPSEVHIQRFARSMAHLNTLARTHDLDEVPEWYQIVMLVASLQSDSEKEGKMYAAFKDAKMKSLGRLKLKNLAADSVERAHWEKEFEVRRGGPGKQGVKNEEVKEGKDGAVETRKKAVGRA